MKFNYQLTNSDCLRACVSTLLELPILSVPDFTAIPDPDALAALPGSEMAYPAWYRCLQEFLRKFGMTFIEIQLSDRIWMPLPFETLAIFMGPLPSGSKHAIVGKLLDGEFYPIFDPRGEDQATFTTIEAVCLLVSVDPGLMMRMGSALEEIEKMSDGIPGRILGDSIRDVARAGMGKQIVVSPMIFGPDGQKAGQNGKILSL